MNGTETFARKPRPLLRSIEWRARPENGEHDSADETASQPPFEIFLTQRLLRAVERHLSEQADGTGWGLLTGEVHECPVSGRRWVLATEVLAGPGSFDEDGSRQVPDEGELSLQLKAERDGRVVVGWYHGHATGRPRFTARDRTTNERLSVDPWQFGLLLVQDGTETSGAVMHAAVDEGRIAVPFHEVVGNDALMADGGRRTCLTWTNLVTEAEVVAAAPERSNAAEVRSSVAVAADEDTAERQAHEKGVDGGSAGGGGSIARPAGSRRRARHRVTLPPALRSAIRGAIVQVRALPDLLRSRPTTGTAVVGIVIVAVVMLSLLLVIRRAGEGGEGPLAASFSGAVSAVPADGDGPQSPVAESPSPPVETPAVETPAAGTPAAEPMAGESEPEPAGAAATPLDRLDTLGNATLAAISRFYGITVALDEGRADCPALGKAYVTVEDAWIAYSAEGRTELVARLEGERLERDSRLLAGVQDVERLFEGSGCSRP